MVVVDKAKEIDVLFLAEGTYPYVRGGVSTWIHEIIENMPEFKFGVLFLGSKEEDYPQGIQYKIPENVVYLESIFLFSEEKHPEPIELKGSEKVFYLKNFFLPEPKDLKALSDPNFYLKEVSLKDFLFSKKPWEFIETLYLELDIVLPFVQFFWNIRNLFLPLWSVASVFTKLENKKIGLIHSPSTGYAGFLGSLLKQAKNIPFIITEHGLYTRERKIDILNFQEISPLQLFLKRKAQVDIIKELWINFFINLGKIAYLWADKIISLFEQARSIQISLGAPEEKTLVIPNGVKIEKYKPLRKTFSNRVAISTIGRIVPIKDIKTFIKGFKLITEHIPTVKGLIVGPEEEAPIYVKECKNLVTLLDLKDRIEFLGYQEMEKILEKTNLCVLTSISEGMPIVILEAMASGIPCITTDVGACNQLIYGGIDEEDISLGRAGEVIPVANPSALAQKAIELLTNPELYKACQKTAIKRIEKYYTLESMIKAYKNLYKDYL